MKWLAAAGLGSSPAVVRLISWFPWSIDQQLRLDSGLGMVEYQVLAVLSEAPQRSMGKPSRGSRVSSSQYGGHSVATTATGVSDGWRSRSRSAAAIRSPEGCKRYWSRVGEPQHCALSQMAAD